MQNPGDPILIPTHLASKEVDYECELAVVIKKACKNVSRRDALRFVLGYTCANDVSARDWQKKKGGGQWSRGKSFDSFCPLGPCLVTADEIPDPSGLAIRTILNGETVQDCNTGDMIFDVPALIEFLSGSTTLLAGTVILTGTPHGVGMAATPPRWLAPGDTVSVEIDKIGMLTNPVQSEPRALASRRGLAGDLHPNGRGAASWPECRAAAQTRERWDQIRDDARPSALSLPVSKVEQFAESRIIAPGVGTRARHFDKSSVVAFQPQDSTFVVLSRMWADQE